MQIKLVLLTICASLVAIGFATPSPQDSSSGDELDFGIPNDEQPPPGIDNLSLTGGSDESDEVAILGDPDNEPMAVLVRRRRGASRFLARLGRNRLRKLRKMKKPLQAPSSI
ncbi:hypothetical protein RMATCC62417_01483 [Rhizopus microsporus]|nr:hypothetical protein RMATCC62417_01483 [Rhizopus microsporus]